MSKKNDQSKTLEEILTKFTQSVRPVIQRIYINENGEIIEEPLKPYCVHDNGDISDC